MGLGPLQKNLPYLIGELLNYLYFHFLTNNPAKKYIQSIYLISDQVRNEFIHCSVSTDFR